MSWLKRFWKGLTESPPKETGITESLVTSFTPRAQQVLALARKEADRLNHNYLGTEHLLLGIVKLGQGVAVNVLGKMGVNLETVRQELEKQLGKGPDQQMVGNIPYTPRVKKVLGLAQKEAKALNHTYIGTEHILLGLLREGDGWAARVLKSLGLDLEQTRQEILKELDPNFNVQDIDPSKAPIPGERTPMSSKSEIPPKQDANAERQEPIDLSKRYDVYCSERNQEVVVYRNALLKGIRGLYPKRQFDTMPEFFELEQANGQTIFLSKFSIIKFCEHGFVPTAENISTKKPE